MELFTDLSASAPYITRIESYKAGSQEVRYPVRTSLVTRPSCIPRLRASATSARHGRLPPAATRMATGRRMTLLLRVSSPCVNNYLHAVQHDHPEGFLRRSREADAPDSPKSKPSLTRDRQKSALRRPAVSPARSVTRTLWHAPTGDLCPGHIPQ